VARPSGPDPTAAAPPAPGTAGTPADQVVRHLLAARVLRDGTHRTVMHLSPEHLGQVTVTVEVRDGSVRLGLSAGAAALSALGSDLPDLRQQLAQSGLDLADVTMNSPDAGSGQGGGPRGDRPDAARSAPAGRDTGGSPTPERRDGLNPTPAGDFRPGRLDIRV